MGSFSDSSWHYWSHMYGAILTRYKLEKIVNYFNFFKCFLFLSPALGSAICRWENCQQKGSDLALALRWELWRNLASMRGIGYSGLWKSTNFSSPSICKPLGRGRSNAAMHSMFIKKLGLDNNFKLNFLAEPPLKKWLSKNK